MPGRVYIGWLRRHKIKLLKLSDLSKKQQATCRNMGEKNWFDLDKRVIQIGAYKEDYYNPLENGDDKALFNRFLRADLSKDKNVIALYETVGPLGHFYSIPGKPVGYELVGRLIDAQQKLRWLFDLYVGLKSSNQTGLERLLGKKLKKDQLPVDRAGEIITNGINSQLKYLRYELISHSKVFFEAIEYRSFEEVIYLRFKEYILNQQTIKLCRGCSKFFFSEGKQDWHDAACKNRYYSALAYAEKKLMKKVEAAIKDHGLNSAEYKQAIEALTNWKMQNKVSEILKGR